TVVEASMAIAASPSPATNDGYFIHLSTATTSFGFPIRSEGGDRRGGRHGMQPGLPPGPDGSPRHRRAGPRRDWPGGDARLRRRGPGPILDRDQHQDRDGGEADAPLVREGDRELGGLSRDRLPLPAADGG